jgi:hypothetical protein
VRKSPAEYARWVRKVHELDGDGMIDLADLVRRCGGRVDELPIQGCAGLLVPVDGDFFGIGVRADDSRRRKRFTIAHELGHFCIPSHKHRAVLCVSPDLSNGGSTKVAEREANLFAAELLMPRLAVERMVRTGSLDVARAVEVADLFDVSIVSAALQVSEVTKEQTAVVYFRGGALQWAYRSGMPYGLPATGSSPPARTLAHDIMCGNAGSASATAVDPSDWLPLATPSSWRGELLESSIRLDGDGEQPGR